MLFFFSSRRRHTRCYRDWSSDVCSSDLDGDGTLDPTFGAGGKVLTDLGGAGRYDGAYAVAVEPDGKILAAGFSDAGGSTDFALVRYNNDGSLDGRFGGGGKVLTDVSGRGSEDDARAVAVQADG